MRLQLLTGGLLLLAVSSVTAAESVARFDATLSIESTNPLTGAWSPRAAPSMPAADARAARPCGLIPAGTTTPSVAGSGVWMG